MDLSCALNHPVLPITQPMSTGTRGMNWTFNCDWKVKYKSETTNRNFLG